MSTRIPISWLVLLVVLGVFAFFAYHIVQASVPEERHENKHIPPTLTVQHSGGDVIDYSMPPPRQQQQAQQQQQRPVPTYLKNAPNPDESGDSQSYGDAAQTADPAPRPMPRVVGQTEEDLRAPEPLQATPPTTQYDPPEATDPMNRHVHMGAEFGSNLRHPEQMIERRPAATMASVVPSGLGSDVSRTGNNRQVSFAPEMAQNGGEFMEGIAAFDGSEGGVGYSML